MIVSAIVVFSAVATGTVVVLIDRAKDRALVLMYRQGQGQEWRKTGVRWYCSELQGCLRALAPWYSSKLANLKSAFEPH
jgi:hypothetical protein